MIDTNSFDSRGEKKRLVNNTSDRSKDDEIVHGLAEMPKEEKPQNSAKSSFEGSKRATSYVSKSKFGVFDPDEADEDV